MGAKRVPVVSPVAGVHVAEAQADHEQHHRNLDHHDGGVEARALLDADRQNRRDDQRDHECRQVEADLDSENRGRVQQLMRTLHQFRRLRGHDVRHLVEEGLRAGNQRWIGSLRHLPGDNIFGGAQSGPVVVGQPQRHLDVEDIQQFDEVVRPARRHRAGAHGVFERQVPADDPGEQFAQRGVRVGVGAAGQRNHGGEFGIAESGKRAAQAGQHERQHQPRARHSARPVRTARRCRRR